MDSHFQRHAVITGAGTGIGAAIAHALATAGVRLTLMGRRLDRLEDLAGSLPGASAIACDVTDDASVAAAFARAGAADILIANAGAALTAPLVKTSRAQFQAMLDVNLIGPFLCAQAVLPGMIARKQGRVIAIASTAGLKGYAYTGAYSAAKHGVVGLIRTLALELATSGVTANAICPGFADTELVERALETIISRTGRSRDDALAELVRHNPQGRLIDPAEVAGVVLWLISDAARSVTGQAIAVAGGEVM